MADSEVHLLVLTKKDFLQIIEEYEEFGVEMKAIARERKKYHDELIA
jgi:CRP-like cAMP-binding protein